MKELAQVVAVDGEKVTVSTQLKSACSGCEQNTTCGAGILSKVFSDRHSTFVVKTQSPVTVGEYVELSIPEQQVTRFALLLYGLPVLTLLLLASVLTSFTSISEGYTILLSFAGFALSFLALRLWFRLRDVRVNQLLVVSTPAQPSL
ncbi:MULTISPECIES: SoxR reducing system RseC family protein [Idiomarina]|jgi:sigma-E factor negative regulatory protein RseC|uniref:Fis family transcriptional regulator n=2 Tax=Idiomarina baltica TaxID=190892 RepID=A0A348WLI1_9GAMM|nr:MULTISPECIES: SoxR reducing system RseC family protein [Idiomarina]MAF75191.1 Fis family transcriptional regulator [Idiomarinaceae bacterium]MEC8924659.1 SoxR reducing system RseC family protein [Pseudomonadota bacterium]EAQ31160.1 Positive regulator of sigma E activity [Idiomarina baltica OS145]KXS35703.1 MAG: positive regulator of sigma E activity [Idiomarina sp. T82-3]MBL73570.1 Fis family transcriptional regulator [Idiomarinaceae bacterium]|tara:strand:- start:343 stop:783 length:441 start_codon:yes stop_codon:yes gene_type:complete